MIILVGWVAKTAVASLVSGWVGKDAKTGEAWLAYSIP
jgi:lipid intermediate transporter